MIQNTRNNLLSRELTDFVIENLTFEIFILFCITNTNNNRYEYHWADGVEVKKAMKVSAPEYVDFLMTWIQKQLDDEKIFPSQVGKLHTNIIIKCALITTTRLGVAFPKNFSAIVKNIMKRLFRVYAHIYCEHFTHIAQLQAEAHLNTSFKHFLFFIEEHDLVPEKEMAPLADLIKSMKAPK